ncbi:MAG TPA: hypothetical protein VIV65_06015 [Gemmatimonadaceae bacterium]
MMPNTDTKLEAQQPLAVAVPEPKMSRPKGEVRKLVLARSSPAAPDISAVAWSPDGRLIATAHNANLSVTVWDAGSLKVVKELKQATKGFGLRNVAFSPDGRYLVAGLRTISVWTTNDWAKQAELVAPHIDRARPQVGGIQALGFNPDGSLLAVAYGGQQAIVIGYDFPKGAIRWTYEPKAVQGTPSVATGIVFSADGRRLMFGTGEVGRDTDGSPTRSSAIAVLDSWTGIQERRIDRIHVDHPTALAISPDDKWLVSATSTGTVTQTANLKTKQRITRENNDPVRVWNINNGGLLKELPVQSRVWSLVVTKDGRYVIGSRSDHKNQLTLVMWDVEAAAIAQEIQTREVSIALALSSDGRELAGAAGKELVIYGLQ